MERGTLIRWNTEKGFGFIKPETGDNQDVFIHISTLKHMARKPIVGDEILFHRENQPDGKVKAVKASIEGVAVVSNTTRPASHTGQHHRNNPSHHDENYRSSPVLGRVIRCSGHQPYQNQAQSIYNHSSDAKLVKHTAAKCAHVQKQPFISVTVQELKWMVMGTEFHVKGSSVIKH